MSVHCVISRRNSIGLVACAMVCGLWASLPGHSPAHSPSPASGHSPSDPTEGESADARAFVEMRLSASPERLPFSFVYGDVPSARLLSTWKRSEKVDALDANRTRRSLRFEDPKTGLEVRCEGIVYRDFPTVEWTLHFRNTGDAKTPILRDVKSLDMPWQRADKSEFLLHHAYGSPANRSDYGPIETWLGPNAKKRIAAAGGRPTNSDWSYFNIQWGAQGVIVVVGWPGQWAAEFVRDAGNGLSVRAGQETFHATLLPGEEFRSPLMVLQFWRGDYSRSQNVWRRWMQTHSMPKPGGKLPPPQFVASSSRAYEEMIKADQQNQIMHVDRYLEEGLKLDYWWMDAGWYVQQQGWPQVGTWEVDRKRFPRGFRAISDHAHARGVKILVWFEPERVAPGTWLYQQRPQWLLRASKDSDDSTAGLRSWYDSAQSTHCPNVTHNPTPRVRTLAAIRWEPGQLAFHPGPAGQYGVVRFTAPESGRYDVSAAFSAIDRQTTTDVHLMHRGRALLDGNVSPAQKRVAAQRSVEMAKGDALDAVVGWGNGSYICDSTGLDLSLRGPSAKSYDAAKQFDARQNPAGPWSYGHLKPGNSPDAATFRTYDQQQTGDGATDTRLLNLGNPAARQWLTDHVDKLLSENGIDLYRQDFNIDPLAFWQANDAPDRQGVTENKYLVGYLAYWDELRRRHPGMLIDSCASGGRRNDLETMRRAVPLWRSDYAFEPIGHQCMTYGISLWLPYHGTGTVASAAAAYYGGGYSAVEPYAFWSNTAPSLGFGIDIRVRELDYAALRTLYTQWRTLSRFYYDDFYPLTAYSQDNRQWIAWQFNSPERGEGAIQAFRRAEAPAGSMQCKLHDLEPDARYELTILQPPATKPTAAAPAKPQGTQTLSPVEATGRELMESGVKVSLADKPAAAVIIYRRK